MRAFESTSPSLQHRPWPFVNPFKQLPESTLKFIRMSDIERRVMIRELRNEPEVHGKTVNEMLYAVYAYRFGYPDSPCCFGPDDELETQLECAKICLEAELLHFLGAGNPPDVSSQEELASRLEELALSNPGVNHPLFDYIETDADAKQTKVFLMNEVIRNELVDDEVALLVAGKQGLMKEATAINLFDEVGRGHQAHAHTYWLRLLLESHNMWQDILDYRQYDREWFNGITSNVFAMLLTRSPFKFAAYGHFLITESWVKPHFQKIVKGLRRNDLTRGCNDVYFTAHIALDPTHAAELIMGLRNQVPTLTPHECSQILWGGRLAVAGAMHQYNRMLSNMVRRA